MSVDLSKGEEQYLKRVLEVFEEDPSTIVKTSDLAKSLEVSPASVTEMLKKLASRELITHIPYRGSRLTSQGFVLANKVKRRQLLIEILLTDVAGITSRARRLAADFEHHLDQESEYELDKALGFPSETLDGRKISDIERRKTDIRITTNAFDMETGTEGIIYSLKLANSNLGELSTIGIRIGSKLERTETGIKIDGTEYSLDTNTMFCIMVRQGD
tara:strand:+ start:2296 stop:2943 length:648 start_codon:yes stop_codon:yes gene_type:complete